MLGLFIKSPRRRRVALILAAALLVGGLIVWLSQA